MEVEKSKTESPSLPFARVMVVVQGSPADTAGLKQGDLVCRFGSVTKDNFKQLKNISDVAEASRGRNVDVIVVRDNNTLRLRVLLSLTTITSTFRPLLASATSEMFFSCLKLSFVTEPNLQTRSP